MIIAKVLATVSLFGLAGTMVYLWRLQSLRDRAFTRLGAPTGGTPDTRSYRATESSLRRPLRFIPWCVGLMVLILTWPLLGWGYHFSIAASVCTAMLGNLVESFLAQRKVVRMESQLADAIDIMVGAVSAGAGVSNAIDAAILETQHPLKRELEEVSGRIRLGDNPSEVFEDLSQRVPLETFLLFSSTMSVHWEVGGQLAPTLATISRTVRDRIETSRRIRSNTSQSQMSTIAIVGLTYLIAFVVWRNNPVQMVEFINSGIGGMLVAVSIVMQAIGIFWMNAISKVRF